ncbi:hypothetical protein FRC12_024193, partial [Ceratobasidium sp. 428]
YQVTLGGQSSLYNASSWWLIGDATIYSQGGLDPNQKHTVTLINKGYDASLSTLSLNSITVFGMQPPNGLASRHLLTGAIVGGVVGGVMFLLLCATAFFAYLRRRSRRRGWYPEHVGRDPSGIDDCKEHNYVAVPFQSPPGSAQPTSFTQPPIGYVGRATKGDRATPAVPQEPHHVVSGASPTSDTGVWQAGVAIALIRRMRMQKADVSSQIR